MWTAAAPVLRHWVLSAFNFPRDWAVEQLRGASSLARPPPARSRSCAQSCGARRFRPRPEGAGLGAGL